MVHDEIIVEADDDVDLLKAVQKDLEEGMVEGTQPMLRRVPVVVEGNTGPSWAEK
jgi:DNA polymerase I-like protein with 3'-5' exonuclease and polymerase domains